MALEIETLQTAGYQYPEERAAWAAISANQESLCGTEPLRQALEENLIRPGEVTCAEITPTLRCSENCQGCPDALSDIQNRVRLGFLPRVELRARPEEMIASIKFLNALGVRHYMFIGGTIDNVPGVPDMITATLALDGARVSWFTDGILLTEEGENSSGLLRSFVESGWIYHVATHLSFDYPLDQSPLPSKAGRSNVFANDREYSRIYKSQYGMRTARNLIDLGVRRIVLNTTVSHKNVDCLIGLYNQVADLQEYAWQTGSPTEVLQTFSAWIWRSHQARGDNPAEHSPILGLSTQDMPKLNAAINSILEDTYQRLETGNPAKPRLLANSSGFSFLHALPELQRLVIEQDFPYRGGKPEVYNVNFDASVWPDPMTPLYQALKIKRDIWGYRDRAFSYAENPYTQFQNKSKPWFPNIIST